MNEDRCRGAISLLNGVERIHTATHTIVADGVWSRELSSTLKLPLRGVKGQFIRLKGLPLITRTIRTPDVYMIPRDEGELYIGASMDEDDLEPNLRAGAVLDGLYHAFQAVRGVYELDILKIGMGFRPALRDHNPAVGKTPIDGLYLNIGHFRHGILLAPIAAKELLHKVIDEDKETRFNPLRLWT